MRKVLLYIYPALSHFWGCEMGCLGLGIRAIVGNGELENWGRSRRAGAEEVAAVLEDRDLVIQGVFG